MSLRYQLRCTNLEDIILYEGYESSFEFHTARTDIRYQFELLVIDEPKNNLLIDRKSIILEAQPQKSKIIIFLFLFYL